MQQIISEYLDRACGGINNIKRQQAVRAELAGHFAEAVEHHKKDGLTEEAAAMRAIAHMGNVDEVAVKLVEANNQVSERKVKIWGYILIGTFIIIGMLWVSPVSNFFDEFSIVLVGAITAGVTLLGGWKGQGRAVICQRVKTASLYAGGIACLIGFIGAFASVPSGDAQWLYYCISTNLIPLFYALTVCAIAHGVGSAPEIKSAPEVLGLTKLGEDKASLS